MAKPSDKPFFHTKRDIELRERLDTSRVPEHVAIIMDGNGRWASKRGLPRAAGHRAGAKAVEEAIRTCVSLGIRYLTLYSFSSENWRRPADEVDSLMTLFVEVLKAKIEEMQAQHVRIRVIGRLDDLPAATAQAFREATRDTAANDRLDVLLALNYGARTEIVDAVRVLAQRACDGALDPDAISEDDVLSGQLYTAGVPDPDLVIRTSGEMRLSNFLLWQVAYSELHVTSVLWPDFDRGDLLKAVVDLQARDRRFGGR